MTTTRKITIQDVARLAGVSTATVSAVINGNKTVSPPRTQKVWETIEALDYHADQNARGLRTGQTRAIGVVLPDMAHAFSPKCLQGPRKSPPNPAIPSLSAMPMKTHGTNSAISIGSFPIAWKRF